MTTNKLLRWSVAMSLLAFVGCAQRETDVGRSAIPVVPGGQEGQSFVTATHSAEWDLEISNGRGSMLQIGDAQDFVAMAAIRFEPGSVLPDSFELDTARIRFRVDQVYPGRGNAPDLRMLIKEITESWHEDSLRDSSLARRESYPVLDTLLLPTAPVDTSESFPPAIYWNVPDSLWSKWLKDTLTSFGLLLEAENPNVIVGLQSAEGAENYQIQLELVGTSFPEDSNFAAVAWRDTVLAAHDGYLTVDTSDSLAGRVRISQGIYRRALFYFPLDSISANPLRTVVRAWLHLYADASAPGSLTYTGSNFLYKDASLVDTSWLANPDSAVQNFIAINSTAFESDNVEIAFEVTGSLAGMVGIPATNGGFSVQAALENDILSRQYFHAHDSEVDSLRPKLEIWWVQP